MSEEPEPKQPPVSGWPEESADRLAKAEALRRLGIDPYPSRYEPTHTLAEVVARCGSKSLQDLEAQPTEVKVAGRVMTKRGHGKASFATLQQGGAQLQAYVRFDDVGEQAYGLLELVDLGDFIGVAGRVMRTRKGELSVQAKELRFLSKALLPPPEKWHGLSDVEVRYRQRYLDLVANPEVRRTFVARSAMIAEVRRFMDGQGYVEVETPMMQPIPGGALARPFVTHHNALDLDLYLRVAPELYLKRLIGGGLDRVYELNRSFRNEGIGAHHNPEFTMLEFYTAYFDCRDVMAMTEGVVAAAVKRVAGDAQVLYKGRPLNLKPPYARVRMVDGLAAALAGEPGFVPGLLADPDGLRAFITSPTFAAACATRGVGAEYGTLSHGELIAQLFGDFAEASVWDPTFVVDYPVEVSPLAKRRADAPSFADRFELFACGMEIANGFSELNDPLEQRQRFLEQLAARARGDAEAHRMDDDYIRALGHGLPPTGGCGVGIDRLAMLLTDSASIRDVILFPHMRPER